MRIYKSAALQRNLPEYNELVGFTAVCLDKKETMKARNIQCSVVLPERQKPSRYLP